VAVNLRFAPAVELVEPFPAHRPPFTTTHGFSSAFRSHFAQFAAASYVLCRNFSSASSGSADCRIASYGKMNSPNVLSNFASAGAIA
jgi:hypothetical protein